MVALFAEAQRLDIRQYEELGAAEIAAGLSRQSAALVARGIALATAILERYDGASPGGAAEPDLNFELALDAVLAQEPAGHKAADLAFMARTELKQRLARLEGHSPQGDPWEMVCDCGSALRRVQKSLGAIELALCEVEQRPRQLRFDSELAVSLQVRRQYRKLWRFAAQQGEVRGEQARHALRGGGTLLAMLVGRDVYCRLRERDRYQLRQLQRRILAWLERPADERAGVRLWQDFAGFVDLLRQVNLRQELAHHDAEAVRIATRALAGGDPAGLAGAVAVARRLEGADDALDAALADPQLSAPRLLAELRRLAARYGGSKSPPPQLVTR